MHIAHVRELFHKVVVKGFHRLKSTLNRQAMTRILHELFITYISDNYYLEVQSLTDTDTVDIVQSLLLPIVLSCPNCLQIHHYFHLHILNISTMMMTTSVHFLSKAEAYQELHACDAISHMEAKVFPVLESNSMVLALRLPKMLPLNGGFLQVAEDIWKRRIVEMTRTTQRMVSFIIRRKFG